MSFGTLFIKSSEKHLKSEKIFHCRKMVTNLKINGVLRPISDIESNWSVVVLNAVTVWFVVAVFRQWCMCVLGPQVWKVHIDIFCILQPNYGYNITTLDNE